jgi:hypothetical protein
VPSGSSHACSSSSTSGSELYRPSRTFETEPEPGKKETGTEAAGCVALISTGTAAEGSQFLEASESGSDVFFLTTEKVLPQDVDTDHDVYDAHECTAASPCISQAPAPSPCATEASCKAPPTPQPTIYGAPASATFSGPGNLTPSPVSAPKPKPKAKQCPKGKVRKKGSRTCKPKPKKKRAHKARKSTPDRRTR